MKRAFFISCIFIYAASMLGAEDGSPVMLSWTAQNSPWFYESAYDMYNISFSSTLLLGFDVGGVVIGGELLCDYVSMNGQDPARLLQGSLIQFGFATSLMVKPAAWMGLEFAVGGLFQRSSFQYNEAGWLGLNRWGAVGMFDISFAPSDFIGFTLRNRFDLFFAFDSGSSSLDLLPNYTGGLRIDVRPGIDWLSVFVEADALYLDYASDVGSVQSWMFQAQVGLTIDVGFGRKGDRAPVNLPDVAAKPKTLDEIEPALESLRPMKPGTESAFTTIIFEKGKGDIAADSMPILDRIAEYVLAHKKGSISVRTYVEYSGNPVFDLELIKKRSERIRAYLIEKGVRGSAIKLTSMGQVIRPEKSKSEVPTVVIKVLS